MKVTALRPKVVKARGQARRASRRWTTLSRWSLLYAGRWTKEEHNNILEMRAAVSVLRHISRSRRKWRQRVLLFTVSLVTLGVLRKGRSSATALLHLARQASAVCIVCGLRLYVRWVASEDNVADGPSRAQGIGAAEQTKLEHTWRHTPRAVRAMVRPCEAADGA